jgi:hypothetical protein
VYFILYASQATTPPTESEFKHLLAQCHRNNTRHGITGLLLYNNDNYLQIIEGEKKDVQSLFDIISCDHRHQEVVILEAGEQNGRNFPDWAMGFKAATNGTQIKMPAYINLSENQMLFNPGGQITHPALPHLVSFYEQLNQGIN